MKRAHRVSGSVAPPLASLTANGATTTTMTASDGQKFEPKVAN